MIAEQLFQEMKSRHLTTSRRGFSRAWAGMAQNWLCENRTKPLPADVALTVHRKLVRIGERELAATVLATLVGDDPVMSRQVGAATRHGHSTIPAI